MTCETQTASLCDKVKKVYETIETEILQELNRSMRQRLDLYRLAKKHEKLYKTDSVLKALHLSDVQIKERIMEIEEKLMDMYCAVHDKLMHYADKRPEAASLFAYVEIPQRLERYGDDLNKIDKDIKTAQERWTRIETQFVQ